MGNVITSFHREMVQYFPTKAPEVKHIESDLREFDDEVLSEAATWFRRNRTQTSYPNVAECIGRCKTIRETRRTRAFVEQQKAREFSDAQTDKAQFEALSPEDKRYVSDGWQKAMKCLAQGESVAARGWRKGLPLPQIQQQIDAVWRPVNKHKRTRQEGSHE